MTKATILKIPAMRAKGMTNAEIAAELHIKERTLAYWISRLRQAGHELPKVKPKGRTPLSLDR